MTGLIVRQYLIRKSDEVRVHRADKGRALHRAFENVIRNAVKYTAEGTAVQVQARIDTAADALVVTVLDRGPGVPEAMRERMFQPFVRLEGTEAVRGVGLGLAIARRAVHLHGGDIRASARPGGGLLQPARRAEREPPARPPAVLR